MDWLRDRFPSDHPARCAVVDPRAPRREPEGPPLTIGCTNPQCRVVEYLPRGGAHECCPACYNRSQT